MEGAGIRTASGAARRIPALDGFRGWAALGIVTLHVLGLWVILQGDGSPVEILADGTVGQVLGAFFIISGFGLFHQVVARRGELGGVASFYRRRLARIYPGYWFCLVVLLIAMAIYRPVFAQTPNALDLAIQFTGLQMPARLVDSAPQIGFGVDTAFWFVSVLLGYYLVFPLIARPYYRHPWIGLLTAALVSIAWREAAAHLTGVFDAIQTQQNPAALTASLHVLLVDQFPGWAFSFATGMTLAWVYDRLRAMRSDAALQRAALRAGPVVLAVLALAVYLIGNRAADVHGALAPTVARGSTLIPVFWSAAVGAAMLLVLVGPDWLRIPFVNRPIRRLGELSYGIFLIQAAIIVYLISLFPGWVANAGFVKTALFYLTVLTGSILYAMVSRRFVELPAARWAARWERRRDRGSLVIGRPPGTPLPADRTLESPGHEREEPSHP
jgi:peptidoglycan/LPS O-acetylase OafA/YrhL